MSKNQSANKQPQTTMAFLDKKPDDLIPAGHINSVEAKQDPLYVPRRKFINAAKQQVELIKNGESSGRWFKKDGDRYLVWLRNGVTVLTIFGDTKFWVPSKDKAIGFLTQAYEAAERKELDTLLQETAPAPRARKTKKTPDSAAQSVSP